MHQIWFQLIDLLAKCQLKHGGNFSIRANRVVCMGGGYRDEEAISFMSLRTEAVYSSGAEVRPSPPGDPPFPGPPSPGPLLPDLPRANPAILQKTSQSNPKPSSALSIINPCFCYTRNQLYLLGIEPQVFRPVNNRHPWSVRISCTGSDVAVAAAVLICFCLFVDWFIASNWTLIFLVLFYFIFFFIFFYFFVICNWHRKQRSVQMRTKMLFQVYFCSCFWKGCGI